jgi:hypothetical protein
MGVERAVTRWYLQHQHINDQIAVLQAKLEQVYPEGQGPANDVGRADIEKQLEALRLRLRTLGPCPKPMMG